MSNWKVMKLSEVATIVGGGTPSSSKSEYFENGNIPWITPKDLSGYKKRYISKGERNITELGLKNSSAKLLPKNTVLLTSRAPIGYVAIASNEISTNQGFKSLVLNDGHIPEFFYYLLKNNVHILESRATGSTFKEISGQILKDTELSIPTPDIQQKIVDILSPLDDKIELNTQINQTLEQIAQALFKSWFVDFDPVRAKVQALSDGLSLKQAELAAMQAISGKTPEELTALSQTQPDRYAELAEIAKAFPCEMVEVDGVEVPKGWECFSLKELSSVISKGTTPKKSSLNSCDSKETVPFIKVKDISESGQILINQVEQIPKTISSTELKRSILHKNDILISIAGTIGRVAIVPNELENANTNQAISFIRLYNDNLVGIISTFLKSRKNQEDILSKVIQGVQANISLEVVRNIKIFLPINFNHKAILIFNSLLNKQLINQKENLLIEKTRDLLLPRLLSGEF